MRPVLICAVGVAITVLKAFPASAQTDAVNDLPKPVEQCIRDYAPAVERAIDRLPDAVDFLVGDLCAKPIAEEQMQQQKALQEKMFASLKHRCTQRSNRKSDETDANCAMLDATSESATGWTIYAPAIDKPADATSLAARLLLQLRTQHLNATSTQGSH